MVAEPSAALPRVPREVDPRIAALPKVELHVHLDCCLSFSAVSRLLPGMTLSRYRREFVAPSKCRDLGDFLHSIDNSLALLQGEAGLRLAVADLFDQFARDRVVYAEIRFAPLLHLAGGLSPDEVMAAVVDETGRQVAETGIEARWILCTLRHFDEGQGLLTARLAERFRDRGVVALDLAADEARFPLAPHQAAFRTASELGLGLTAHAGEALGPASVRDTLRLLGPRRLGHGVRSAEEPELVERLRREGIHLEICPSCNVQTGIYPTLTDHPVDRLFRAGMSLGINTDARTVTGTTLGEEYMRLHEAFGWGLDHFRAVNRSALSAAFLPEADRQRLGRLLAGEPID